ncbi:MAG: thaumatin family protein [Deltaproteobacteria bacterium]
MQRFMIRNAAVIISLLLALTSTAFAASPKPHKITFKNRCPQTIWVGQDGKTRDGWEMKTGATVIRHIPVGFSGRWWPRTGCRFNSAGRCPTRGVDCCDSGGCLTTDHNYYGLKCNSGGNPPVSLFEPTFDAHSGHGPIDYLDLSAVDGFSVPMRMTPDKGTYNPKPDPGMKAGTWCQSKGWVTNPACPPDLWDAAKKICWGPCKYYTVVKKVTSGKNKANICCDNTNVAPHPTPAQKCEKHSFPGGYGCSPYSPGYDDERCYAKDPGKRGYWGDIADATWPEIKNSTQYITNVNTGAPGIYAWQFDDLNSTYNCRKTGGTVDYTITFCPSEHD